VAVTMKDVAALAGVSPKTVSNVINGYQYVTGRTRDAVLAAIDELGYRVNLSARSLRSGRTGMIMLALPDLTHPFFAELAGRVIREAAPRGMRILITQTNGTREEEEQVLAGFSPSLADGLIFSPLVLGPPDRPLFAVDYPLVTLGEWIPDDALDRVATRDEEAAFAATSLLIAGGARRIVAIGAYDDWPGGSSALRMQGYRRALAESGIEVRDELVVERRDWHRSDGVSAVIELLDAGVAFDGIFALNDSLALGALFALRSRGIAVPRDVGVVGYDDVDEAKYSEPPLTTIHTNTDEIARLALDSITMQLGAEAAPTGSIVRAGFELIRRGSTP
jgi:DNA-binding LacI/PurR family transcriptional regulator